VEIVEPDALADGILGYIETFREVLESGTPEQRKTFLRAFVSNVELNPDRGDGTVQLWDVPEPVGGNLSFLTVAGARSEGLRIKFGGTHEVKIRFERRKRTFRPVG
jgi:hypothetical protein